MRNLLLISIMLASVCGFSQRKLEPNWYCDELGFLYSVNENFVQKYSNGVLNDYRFSTMRYGAQPRLDLTNPFLPFLFFPDQGTLIYLDNNLTLVEDPIFCNDRIQGQIEAIGGSRGDALWLYEANDSKLIKTSRQLEPIYTSNNLSLQLGTPVHVTQIIEHANRVILVDPQNGLLVFSLFGAFEKQIPLYPTSLLNKSGDYLYFIADKQWYRWNKQAAEPSALAKIDNLILITKNNWIVKNTKVFEVEADGILKDFQLLENLPK